MKVLLLSPDLYAIHATIISGFEQLNYKVCHFDYRRGLKEWQSKLNVHSRRLPFSYREKWNKYILRKINKQHILKFEEHNPDIVFIYNNELLLPETILYFKKRGSKIVFFLGDSPYYTNTHDYFLSLLFYADLIVSPDSFWISQLNLLGIHNTTLEFFPTNAIIENKNSVSKHNVPKHDLLFIGMGYSHSWGYKRALFASKFANLDLQIHGDSLWIRWLEFFPELKLKFILKNKRYSEDHMKTLYENFKIYPVDANPGLLNGMHVRIFDCLNFNLLPLPEYRKDIETVFIDTGLPIIKDYNKAESLAQYYLDHDNERKELVNQLKEFINHNYNPKIVFSRILDKL